MSAFSVNFTPIVSKITPLLTFQAAKYVVIKDWRLGLLLKCLQIAIVVYVAWDIFTKEAFLMTEVPIGNVTAWAEDGEHTTEAISQQLSNGTLPYCSVPTSYEHYDTPSFIYTDLGCIYQPLGASVQKTSDSMFFTTLLIENKQVLVKAAAAADCPDPADVLEGSSYNGYTVGACSYGRKRSSFDMSSEQQTLAFMHSYATSIVGVDGSLPRTVVKVKGSDDILMEFNGVSEIKMSVKQWMALAGVDLDKRLGDQAGVYAAKDEALKGASSGFSNGLFPYARLSGLEMIMDLKYYNYKLEPNGVARGKGKRDVVCVLEVTPKLTWTDIGSTVSYATPASKDPVLITVTGTGAAAQLSLGTTADAAATTTTSTDTFRQGVLFTFRSSGVMGVFNYRTLIAALIQGSVLLGVAHVVVTLVAAYCLGHRSALYSEFMRESCDFKQEYARFAAQALVAAYAFKGMDVDGTRKLDKRELVRMIQDVMGAQLSDSEAAGLTEFLVTHADDDKPVAEGELSKTGSQGSSIDIVEWIDIFTGERCSFPALRRILAQEYPKMKEIKDGPASPKGEAQPGRITVQAFASADHEQSAAVKPPPV